jgi:hypothetical protein
VKAVDPRGHSLKPFFDVIPDLMVESTARIVAREGGQIAASSNGKLRAGDIVFLGELNSAAISVVFLPVGVF